MDFCRDVVILISESQRSNCMMQCCMFIFAWALLGYCNKILRMSAYKKALVLVWGRGKGVKQEETEELEK